MMMFNLRPQLTPRDLQKLGRIRETLRVALRDLKRQPEFLSSEGVDFLSGEARVKKGIAVIKVKKEWERAKQERRSRWTALFQALRDIQTIIGLHVKDFESATNFDAACNRLKNCADYYGRVCEEVRYSTMRMCRKGTYEGPTSAEKEALQQTAKCVNEAAKEVVTAATAFDAELGAHIVDGVVDWAEGSMKTPNVFGAMEAQHHLSMKILREVG